MNTPAKLGAYALGLAVTFGGALGAGTAVGPIAAASTGHDSAQKGTAMAHGGRDAGTNTAGGGHGGDAEAGGVPGGLAVSRDGYTLRLEQVSLPVGQPATFRFTINGPDGQPVTRYTPEYDKDLHLIVVRRDLSGFQHLHPTQGADGVWSQQLTLPAAGDYRAFADFVPAAEGARSLTLGVDLHAAGDYAPLPLPAPTRTAVVDGYTVILTGYLRAGSASPLTLSVRKDGRVVTDLQPYLAAYGHLVALRAGDLAYLHVHPEGHPGDGRTRAGPDISFVAEVPTGGTYRLYLDFQHRDVVRTAEFTVTAAGPVPAGTSSVPADATAPTPSATPSPGLGHTH